MLSLESAGAAVVPVRRVTEISSGWTDAVKRLGGTTLAHGHEWHRAIAAAYGHEPLYLTVEDEGAPGVLPAFVVRRPLAGTIVSSMPFLDGGGPCGASEAVVHALVARLLAEAHAIGARAVELRSATRLPVATAPSELKVNMSLTLTADPDRLWRRLDKTVRNQVRKAERSGLDVEVGGIDRLSEFYGPYLQRMRELGSPPHPLRFFQTVGASFAAGVRVVLVRNERTTVGGLIALPFKDRLVVPWAACLKRYFAMCPNMLMYWSALRLASTEGFRIFDFGRSTRGSGTYRFKQQWGADDQPLFWYAIPLTGRRSAGSPARRRLAPALAQIWQRLPSPITQQIGSRLRKYLVQ
jgi:FemAB-related protein (PEP-CTERM system-associated)